MIQQPTDLPPEVPTQSSYYFNDEFFCLDALQSLIQPEAHINTGNQFSNIDADMRIPQEWNIQPMASQEPSSHGTPRYLESQKNYNQANSVPHSHLYDNSLEQPTWSMNSFRQDISNFGVSTSNPSVWDNNFKETQQTRKWTQLR
ncbi:SUMO activating enzyme 1B [Striga asiatica]|uniref:SUMO activating enzyme 1B n=1 Tax=Striga asiatica TaxID=4170 RepID=A0A5A7QJI0_STRAF|nr:SUMO activating enzyme 1B [Striga asiatica]